MSGSPWILATALLLSNCGLVEKHHLTGAYYLVAENVPEQMKVTYNREPGVYSSQLRIPETVFAVGWDRRYIVAMQHPKNDRRITRFYYIDTTMDGGEPYPAKSVVGPLSEAEFKRKTVELGLPQIRRTMDSLR